MKQVRTGNDKHDLNKVHELVKARTTYWSYRTSSKALESEEEEGPKPLGEKRTKPLKTDSETGRGCRQKPGSGGTRRRVPLHNTEMQG